MSKSPRVFDLPTESEAAAPGAPLRPGVAIEEQPNAFPLDPVAAEPPPPPTRKGFGLVGVALSAFVGFLLLVASTWAWTTVTDLVARNAILGWAAAGLLGVAVFAALAWIMREAAAIRRLARIDRLRERGAAAFAARDDAEGKAVADELAALYRDRPESARGRARLAALGDDIIDGEARLALAERELLGPLDAQARAVIAGSAKRVSVVTALSPRALVDILFVTAESLRLIRRLASLYGGRPGSLGAIRLVRAVLSHLALTGGVALGDEALHQLVGQGLAARISARLGEGVLNGLLTARVGLAALAACRPLPFLVEKQPSVREVAGALWSRAQSVGDTIGIQKK